MIGTKIGYTYLIQVLEFQNFAVNQILRKISFLESRSFKTTFFAIVWALTFVNLVNLSLQKVQKFIKNQNSEPLNVIK